MSRDKLENHIQCGKFNALVDYLNKAMVSEYGAVSRLRNPIAIAMPLEEKKVKYVIGQYTLFPRSIVSFLSAAKERVATAGWKEVKKELGRNIGEELGTRTDGVSHYQMLLSGLDEIGLDAENIGESAATQAFVNTMRAIMNEESPAYVAGAIYACESTAVPELEIVVDVTKYLFARKQTVMSLDFMSFFDMHLHNWEPGHEQGLRNNLARYIVTQEQFAEFESGFRAVLTTMDTWWHGLYKECNEQ